MVRKMCAVFVSYVYVLPLFPSSRQFSLGHHHIKSIRSGEREEEEEEEGDIMTDWAGDSSSRAAVLDHNYHQRNREGRLAERTGRGILSNLLPALPAWWGAG